MSLPETKDRLVRLLAQKDHRVMALSGRKKELA